MGIFTKAIIGVFISLALGSTNRVNACNQNSDRVKVLTFDQSDLPPNWNYQGKVIDGRRWRDKNGLNFFVCLMEEKNDIIKMQLRHFFMVGDQINELHDLEEIEEKCNEDLSIIPIKESFYVSDFDNDGIGEVTFIFRYGCRTGMSPLNQTLYMLEHKKKYEISGTTVVGDAGGKENIIPQFHEKPEFLEFAEHHWQWFKYEF